MLEKIQLKVDPEAMSDSQNELKEIIIRLSRDLEALSGSLEKFMKKTDERLSELQETLDGQQEDIDELESEMESSSEPTSCEELESRLDELDERKMDAPTVREIRMKEQLRLQAEADAEEKERSRLEYEASLEERLDWIEAQLECYDEESHELGSVMERLARLEALLLKKRK